MRIISAILLLLLVQGSKLSSQVIYERNFDHILHVTGNTIQLADTSSIFFERGTECSITPFLHTDKYGMHMDSKGFSLSSTHSTGMRVIGRDSVLIWNRVGPMDYIGDNYFMVELWTPDQLDTLVMDSLPSHFLEDRDVPYNAFLVKDDKVAYRKNDSLFVLRISTHQILNKVIIPGLGNAYPFLDNIIAFPNLANPVIYTIDLLPVAGWGGQPHPVNSFEPVALDSFLIGIISREDATLHIVNGWTEAVTDMDLSGYFSFIDDVQVNTDGLFVKGKRGSTEYVVQINKKLQLIHESILDLPDLPFLFQYAYYSDRVYAWNTDGISIYRMTYHYPEAGPIHFIDISLDSIWVDSVYLWPHEMHLPATLFLMAHITNHSADTIHSFTIFYSAEPFIRCDPGIYPHDITGLNILPGETNVVPVSAWAWEPAEHKPLFRTYSVYNANHHLDDQFTDNTFELSYFLSDVRLVKENLFSAWPNPFQNFIETSNDVESLKMYNSLGQQVANGDHRLADLDRLPAGTYFVVASKSGRKYYSTLIKTQ